MSDNIIIIHVYIHEILLKKKVITKKLLYVLSDIVIMLTPPILKDSTIA